MTYICIKWSLYVSNRSAPKTDASGVGRNNTTESINQELFIQHFLAQLVKQQMDMKKRKDNAKRMCLLAEILVFIGLFLLTILFTKTILEQFEMIINISKINAQIDVLTNLSNSTSSFQKFFPKLLFYSGFFLIKIFYFQYLEYLFFIYKCKKYQI